MEITDFCGLSHDRKLHDVIIRQAVIPSILLIDGIPLRRRSVEAYPLERAAVKKRVFLYIRKLGGNGQRRKIDRGRQLFAETAYLCLFDGVGQNERHESVRDKRINVIYRRYQVLDVETTGKRLAVYRHAVAYRHRFERFAHSESYITDAFDIARYNKSLDCLTTVKSPLANFCDIFRYSDLRKRLTLIERIRAYLRHAARYIHVAERQADSKSITIYRYQALGQSNALELSAILKSRYAYLDHAVGHVYVRQLAAIIKSIVSQLDYTAVVGYYAVFTAQDQSTIDSIYQTVPVAAIDTVPLLH